MRISAKARYGLAAAAYMAKNYHPGECITVVSMSEKLKISKIYLEQVFALLKRGGVVSSTKGAYGGYQLMRTPKCISVFDVLSSIETSFFEKTEPTVAESNEGIEKAMQEVVFVVLDKTLQEALMNISLEDIVNGSEKYRSGENYMYYL